MDGTTLHTDDLCCRDERSGGGGLVPVAEAIARGLALGAAVTEIEDVELCDAIGRVLADDVCAPFALPPFDNSAMDGYAVRSADMMGQGPWRLRVVGRIAAGDNAQAALPLAPGQAYRIFTGAGIPRGADAVIMQEHVERQGDDLMVKAAVAPGCSIRRQGEDAPQGSLLLTKGSLIGVRKIAALASIGLPQVRVHRKLRIALFCTGSELRQPGQSLAPGQIYNSNRYMMIAALRQPWIELLDLGVVVDDPDRLRAALVSAAEQADMVVTTGGVSVGEEDHMVEQLRCAGGQIEVMKIAMKPGKPLSIGTLKDAVFVGLPGNPVAAYTAWKIIGSQVAQKLSGQVGTSAPDSQVEMTQSFTRRPGRLEYRPATIVGFAPNGRPKVQLLDHNFSAKISLICKSDGFAVIPMESEAVEAGDCLAFVPL